MPRFPLHKLVIGISAGLLLACGRLEQPQAVQVPTAAVRPTPLEPPAPLPPPPESGAQADLVVEVDLSDVQGTVNPLAGLQGGPLPVVRGDADLTEWYRQGGVDHVRLPQDTLPNNLTLGGVFPNLYAPTDDPRSYDFRRIDRYVGAIVEAGATPLWQATYDLGGGDTLSAGDTGQQAGRFPVRSDQWASAIQGTLAHFNDGWAGGHTWQVRYVEFTNEPFTLGGCWADGLGLDACWSLFQTFAAAINGYNTQSGRDVQIVGPGMVVAPQELDTQVERLGALLDQLDPDQLDYLSFHPQGRTPVEQDGIAQELRRLLDTYDGGKFATVGLWASQWSSVGPGESGGPRLAALDTATRILWQDTVDFATLYRADRWPQGPAGLADPDTGEVACADAVVCEESPYFTPDGEPKAPFWPFLALAEIGRETPERVAVANARQHLTPVLAARSADAGQLSVLMAAPNAVSETYTIVLSELPPGVSFRAERFVVDDLTEEWEPREETSVQTESDGTLTLNGQFFGPSVVYWRLRAE